jgi:Restriction endonuclease
MDESDLPFEAREALAKLRDLEMAAQGVVQRAQARVEQLRTEQERERKSLDRERGVFETMRASQIEGRELLARAWADYENARTSAQVEKLRIKGRPARRAADEVRAKGKELAKARRQAKLAEWIVELYEFHFPWLVELRDLEEEVAYVEGLEPAADAAAEPDDRDADPAAHWLSADEYRALPTVERNQRALDRYLRSRKSPWQLGRDYERYIGYLRERDGRQVTYQGIIAGLDDLGRDLLCSSGDEIEVIQCKRWAKHKTIHEKHVFQLFGTVVAARIEYPDMAVRGTFVTTTKLSERAHAFAEQLDITVEEQVPLEEYPRIKCNVGRDSGERIYHLPFDQQYDNTVIEPERDEMWAITVADAEEAGFRRAWRWRPARVG